MPPARKAPRAGRGPEPFCSQAPQPDALGSDLPPSLFIRPRPGLDEREKIRCICVCLKLGTLEPWDRHGPRLLHEQHTTAGLLAISALGPSF